MISAIEIRGSLSKAQAKGYFQGRGWRIRKDGARFWANVATTAIRDANRFLLGYGIITQESRMGEKTRVPSRTALSAQNAVVIVDRKGESSWSILKLKSFSATRDPIR